MSVQLYHGDCLEILPTLTGVANLVFTSPPYGVDRAYEKDSSDLELEFLLRSVVRHSHKALDGGGYLVININDRLSYTGGEPRPALTLFHDEARKIGFEFYDRRIWVKDPSWATCQWHACSPKSVDEFEYLYIYRKTTPSSRVYRFTQYVRECRDRANLTNAEIDNALGTNGMAGHWTSSKSQPEITSLDYWPRLKDLLGLDSSMDRLVKDSHRRLRDRLQPHEWTEWGSRGVWRIDSVRRNDTHPAMFPIDLASRVIRLFTDEGDTVIDPFVGSGTAGVACVQTGRNFIGIELDPGYFAIAEKRIAEAQMQMSLLEAAG